MKKMYLASILIFLVVVFLSWYFIKHNPSSKITSTSNLPYVTQEDLNKGWYWGQKKDKRPGTPQDWIHILEGTRSAQWKRP